MSNFFLRNIYSSDGLKKMGVDDTEKYYENFDRIADLLPVVEKALDDGDESVEFKDFMIEELDNVYCTLMT